MLLASVFLTLYYMIVPLYCHNWLYIYGTKAVFLYNHGMPILKWHEILALTIQSILLEFFFSDMQKKLFANLLFYLDNQPRPTTYLPEHQLL